MALKKATEPKSPAAEPVAAAEPVIETPVPVDSGAAEQTPALQPDEPAAVISEAAVAEASIEPAKALEAEVEAAVAKILEPEAEQTVLEALAAAIEEPAHEPFVEVTNLRKTAFRQPSTNMWIFAGETKYLANDGWLENHVNAKLLGYPEVKAED